MNKILFCAAAAILSMSAAAAPVAYTIDADHTFPSFEADHLGISIWRGKFNKSKGRISYDRDTGTGKVELTIDPNSIDFGHDALNKWARGKELLDTKKFHAATYKGRIEAGADAKPEQVVGDLTLHGVTRPVTLKINLFKCISHPMFKRDYCGADASATIDREAFGMTVGKDYGFRMNVDLRIQVEAIADK